MQHVLFRATGFGAIPFGRYLKDSDSGKKKKKDSAHAVQTFPNI